MLGALFKDCKIVYKTFCKSNEISKCTQAAAAQLNQKVASCSVSESGPEFTDYQGAFEVMVAVALDASGAGKDLQLELRRKRKCEMASDPSHKLHRPKHVLYNRLQRTEPWLTEKWHFQRLLAWTRVVMGWLAT